MKKIILLSFILSIFSYSYALANIASNDYQLDNKSPSQTFHDSVDGDRREFSIHCENDVDNNPRTALTLNHVYKQSAYYPYGGDGNRSIDVRHIKIYDLVYIWDTFDYTVTLEQPSTFNQAEVGAIGKCVINLEK